VDAWFRDRLTTVLDNTALTNVTVSNGGGRGSITVGSPVGPDPRARHPVGIGARGAVCPPDRL
jgi:hypothetical protein